MVVSKTQRYLLQLFDKELVFDDEVDSWAFMSSPWPIISIISVYLLFILKVGPYMMKNRKPMNVKYMMLLYNAVQTLFNGWLVAWFFTTPNVINDLLNYTCHPLPRDLNQFNLRQMNISAWYFLLSKILDLLDTVFFVLRKKQSQVTFLHVYHHVNMVFSCWTYLKYIKGEQMVICAVINAIIHCVMYSYYFLSALGPQMQKYLWWKKYLTRMQIVQFLVILMYNIFLYTSNCKYPRLFMLYTFADVSLFLYLFLMFYMKTYKLKSTKKVH
ncbi:Hypothetical protein CINCED_3A021647 [Cinara cedri]|nr:Hypothetical protein CINCED_3A021647 [Cinara cedri]